MNTIFFFIVYLVLNLSFFFFKIIPPKEKILDSSLAARLWVTLEANGCTIDCQRRCSFTNLFSLSRMCWSSRIVGSCWVDLWFWVWVTSGAGFLLSLDWLVDMSWKRNALDPFELKGGPTIPAQTQLTKSILISSCKIL